MNEQIEEEFLNWKDKYNKDTSIQSETVFLNADEPKILNPTKFWETEVSSSRLVVRDHE